MKYKFILLLIVILAFILRFFQLGNNPSSLDWDEASLGYNAYSIIKTGKDEYGNFLPLSIRSFNDYKPPLYTYLTTIPVAIFGLNEFSLRSTSAFLGLLTVVVSGLLIKELFPLLSKKFYLYFLLFFAVSPWHLQFSRIAFEANVAQFFFVSGIYLLLKGLRQGIFLIYSLLLFAMSMYAYHSPRLVVPALLILASFIYFRIFRSKIIYLIFGFVLFSITIYPLIKEVRSSTSARFSAVSVINPDEKLGLSIKKMEEDLFRGDTLGRYMHNRRIVYAREILGGYLDHFNFDFLFLTGDAPGRHHAAGMGMLYYIDFPFIVIGLVYLLNRVKHDSVKFLFAWFIAAPIASSLTSGTPHAVRALLYLPTFQIFSALGFMELINWWNSTLKGSLVKIGVFLTFSLFIFNFFYYLHMYYVHTPIEFASWWQYGYKQAVAVSRDFESEVDKIIVTYRYDQPYIYFLFFNKTDPSWYQKNWGGGEIMRSFRSFAKYEFRNIDWEKDKNLTNVLFIGTPSEIPANAQGLMGVINFPDGTNAFRIVRK